MMEFIIGGTVLILMAAITVRWTFFPMLLALTFLFGIFSWLIGASVLNLLK